MKGRCYCGALQYEAGGKPIFKAQCHCRECQYISGGGPNYFMVLPESAFTYTQGTPKSFSRTDIENPVTREFCGICGTHIATRRTQGMVILKIGTLDDPAGEYRDSAAAIYMADAQPFHIVAEGKPCFDALPPGA